MTLTLLEQDLEATYSRAWLAQVQQAEARRLLTELDEPVYELGSEGSYRPYRLDRQGFPMEANHV